MAAGPFLPSSVFIATSDRLFESFHVGAGANVKRQNGIGVQAALGADAIVELTWDLPVVALPSGTLKLRLLALANATSGAAKVNAKWVSVAAGEDPSTATPIAEGTSTLTWAAGDSDDFKELKIILDADTAVAGEMLVMQLVFETSGWTLAQVSTWRPGLVWE